MATRGIRRKKSSLSEVKIAVFGAATVGKSGTMKIVYKFFTFCGFCINFVSSYKLG